MTDALRQAQLQVARQSRPRRPGGLRRCVGTLTDQPRHLGAPPSSKSHLATSANRLRSAPPRCAEVAAAAM
jgi:hypothetical protein